MRRKTIVAYDARHSGEDAKLFSWNETFLWKLSNVHAHTLHNGYKLAII